MFSIFVLKDIPVFKEKKKKHQAMRSAGPFVTDFLYLKWSGQWEQRG